MIHGTASWPGALAVDSCTYTLSHGISPGTAILKVLPQAEFPAEVGNLVITDGELGTITIPDCKVDSMLVEQGDDGRVWSIAILDRRWKWRDLGQISGCYNQLDPHGKLIPWTIRSPRELVLLCLQAMGETRYIIDVPNGLTRLDGEMHGQLNPPHIGVVPVTGTNPPINWEQEVPAQALANLCEMFGRKVIYQLATDSVLIAINGKGAELPDGSIAHESPAINSPETPTGGAVVGAPTRYQAKFLLEAVGEEWDGSYRPINQLSYRPLPVDGKPQISKATAITASSNTFQVFINAPDGDPPTSGVLFETTNSSATTAMAALAAAINASVDPRIKEIVTASAVSGVLTVTGVIVGRAFSFLARLSGTVTGVASFVDELVQSAESGGDGWALSPPPMFPGVRAVEGRLTLSEARALAQKSVHKCYRLTLVAPTGSGQLAVPGYGVIKRRQQIVLQDTQVEQVVPLPLDPNIVNPNLAELDRQFQANNNGAVANINFYNGYSRDKPAAMFGGHSIQVARNAGFVFWAPLTELSQANTPRAAQIFVPFSINAEEQLVIFSAYVYRTVGDRYYTIDRPVLLTGCNIRNAETNSLEVSYLARPFPGMKGATNFVIRKHPDVQLNLIGKYNADGSAGGATALEADAHMRSRYYLDGLEAQYLVEGALTREYNGIMPIDCDGAISQVTWEIGPNGASTTASRNTEHSVYVPPYPARRRAEFLRPAAMLSLRPPQNLGPAMGSSGSSNPYAGGIG